jgi:hypothetical protein
LPVRRDRPLAADFGFYCRDALLESRVAEHAIRPFIGMQELEAEVIGAGLALATGL